MSAEQAAVARTSPAPSLPPGPAELLSREDLSREVEFFEGLTAATGAEHSVRGEDVANGFALVSLQATAGTAGLATALVTLRGPMGTRTETASGAGPVNALCKAIDRITGFNGNLAYYSARAMTRGRDAVVGVFLKAEFGRCAYLGGAADADIIHASAKAYLSAVNRNLSADAERIELLEFEALTARAGDNARFDDWV